MIEKIGASCHKRKQVVIVSSFFLVAKKGTQYIFINITILYYILFHYYLYFTILFNSAVIIEDITSIHMIFIESKSFIV